LEIATAATRDLTGVQLKYSLRATDEISLAQTDSAEAKRKKRIQG